MSLPLPKSDGIYNVVSYQGTLYRKPTYKMSGWQQFCSGGIISNMSANYSKGCINDRKKRQHWDTKLLQTELKNVNTIADYVRFISNEPMCAGGSHLDLPAVYWFDYFLEEITEKSNYGNGGENMWAGNQQTAKTFVVADRVSETRCLNVKCAGFGLYLEDLQTKGIVRCSKLTNVMGAHGNSCTSWLFAVRLDKVDKYLKDQLHRVNQHIEYLKEYKAHLIAEGAQVECTKNELEEAAITDAWH